MEKKIFSASFKESALLPLYVLLIIIWVLSILLTYLFPSNTFMMYLMGVWFWAFWIMKLYSIQDFVKNFSQYDFIAQKIPTYWYVHPFIEIILWIVYIFDTQMKYTLPANIIGIIISSLWIASAYNVIASQKNIYCACMGTYWKLPMTKITIFENAIMLWMIILMMIFPSLTMNM
jgi:hypothetical protein